MLLALEYKGTTNFLSRLETIIRKYCFIFLKTGFSIFIYHVTIQAKCVRCNVEGLSRNHCCRRKAICTTYNKDMCVALVIQHAESMRLIILLSVTCSALP